MPPNIACITSCCTTTCAIGSDTFPSDGSGAPTGWTLRTGAVDVASGFLDFTTSDSLVKFNTAHPDGIAAFVVTVEVYFGGDDQGIIAFDHSGASDAAYYFVRVTPTTLSLWSRAASVDTLLQCIACDLGGNPSTVVCYFDGNTTGMFAAVCGSKSVYHNVGTGHTGTYVCLGSRTIASEVAFDNFVVEKYSQGSDGCTSFTPDDCDLASDDYSLSDNPDLECPWEQVSGTSARVSNWLKLTASNTLVKGGRSNHENGSMVVNVDFKNSSAGNQAEVGVNYASSSSYHYCRVMSANTLVLGSIAGGTLATSATFTSLTAGDTYHLTMMFSDGQFCAQIYGGGILLGHVSTPVTVSSGERWASLGCRTISGNVQFDNFTLTKGVESDPNTETCEICPGYGPDCDTDCCPEAHTQMIVDIGAGLTDISTCAWCSQSDGTFTAVGTGCDFYYCQHSIADLPDPCDCADYSCDSDCADGGYPDAGTGTDSCRSGDNTTAASKCSGIEVTVTIEVDDDGLCYLKARVVVQNLGPPSPGTCNPGRATIMAEALYATPSGDSIAPCSGRTYTLERYDGAESCLVNVRNSLPWFPPLSPGCGGSWPATITIRSAP